MSLLKSEIFKRATPAPASPETGTPEIGYLGFRDLLKRWVYTRQGLYKIMRNSDFPAPAFTINQGRTKVWRIPEIRAYEILHPEVMDEYSKQRKMIGYGRAVRRGFKGKP